MFAKKLIATSAIVFGLATATVVAQGPRGGGDFAAQRVDRIAADLGLTDSQKQSIQTILTDSSSASRASMDQLRTVRESMAAAVKANKSDAELTTLANQEGQLMAQLALARARSAAKIYTLLTADQKAKADKLPGDLLGLAGGGGGFGGRGRGPRPDGN